MCQVFNNWLLLYIFFFCKLCNFELFVVEIFFRIIGDSKLLFNFVSFFVILGKLLFFLESYLELVEKIFYEDFLFFVLKGMNFYYKCS